MQTIFTELTVSMSDFKRNPAKVLREAGQKPVAVLNHNKPAFYMVDPHMFEVLMERFKERTLKPELSAQLVQCEKSVEFDMNEM